MNAQEKKELIEHFKRIENYSNFKLNFLEDKISNKELFDITSFRVKYNYLKLIDFNDEKIITKCLSLGDKIIDLKY